MRRLLLVVLLVAGTTGPLAGQVPDSLVALGVGAYGNLEYEAAAGYFRRALTALERSADTARLAGTLFYIGSHGGLSRATGLGPSRLREAGAARPAVPT